MASSASTDADREISPVFIMVAGWLVPGAGHWFLGQRRKAVLFFALLSLTFVVGYFLGEFRNVSLDRHPWYFFAQTFLGLPSFVAAFATSHLTAVDHVIPGYDLGILYTCVASLLNALLFLDAYELAERKRLGIAARPGPGNEGKPA